MQHNLPLSLNLDVGLIHSPAGAHRALLALPESGFQLRSKLLDPAVNVGMIDLDATLLHHFLQIPVAQRISQIPTSTEQDEVFFEAVAFEVDHADSLTGGRVGA